MSDQEIAFGKIRKDKIILSGWDEHPEREIGEVRDNDIDASVKYFEHKFEELQQKIEALEKEINTSENKGSFLMKLVHLKEQLPSHDGLGDYQVLYERLSTQEKGLLEIIEKNRERNSEIKTALLEEIKVAAEKINWGEATEEIHEIKSKWIKTGNAKEEDQERLNEEFWGIIEGFFEKKKQFYEDKKRLGDLRKKDYEAVIEKTKQLKEFSGKARFDLITQLKEEWRAVGNIPKEEYTELYKEFNRKLKTISPSAKPAKVNLSDLIKELDAYLSGEKPFHFKLIDNHKRSLKEVRADSKEERQQKDEAFKKAQLLLERDFIDKLASKRFKNFRELEKAKKKSIRIGILEELLDRDKTDLATYQENSANFSGSLGGGMIDLVDKKIQQQKKKITTKETLLNILKAEK